MQNLETMPTFVKFWSILHEVRKTLILNIKPLRFRKRFLPLKLTTSKEYKNDFV